MLLLFLLIGLAVGQMNRCDIELGNVMLFKLTADHLIAEYNQNLTGTLRTLANDAYYLYYPSFLGGYGKEQIATFLHEIQFKQRFDAIPDIGDNAYPAYYITGCNPDTMRINGTVILTVLGKFNFTTAGGRWSLFLPGLLPTDQIMYYYYEMTLTFINNLIVSKAVTYNLADLIGQASVQNEACYYKQFFAPWSLPATYDFLLNPRQDDTPFRWLIPDYNPNNC